MLHRVYLFFHYIRLQRVRNFDTVQRCETSKRHILLKVCSIYDGDTFTALLIDSDGKVRRRRCRCVGYDSPELKGETKEAALIAKSRLIELLPTKPFSCSCSGFDKYGRLLVDPFVNAEHPNNKTLKKKELVKTVMIRENLGYEYHGGKKK